MDLKQKRIVLTRDGKSCERWAANIAQDGGVPITYPCIEICPSPNPLNWKRIALDLKNMHWLVFSSVNAVHFFWQGIKEYADSLEGVKIAAVGSSTANTLNGLGLHVDLQPDNENAAALAKAFPAANEHVLFPKGDLAKNTIPEELSRKDYHVTELVVYQTIKPEGLKPLKGNVDAILFASPSAVKHFFEINPIKQFNDQTIVSIGSSTSEMLQNQGIHHYKEASKPTLDAMLELVCQLVELIV